MWAHPCRDWAPQRCQRTALCSVALSPNVLSLAKYLTMAFEKIHKIPFQTYNYHLSCHSSVHMHIQNHQTTCHRVVLSLTLRQIIPALHPLSSPPSVSGAPGQRCPPHPRQRPLQGAAPRRRRGRCTRPSAAVSDLRRRRARRQRLNGSTPWLSTANPPCSGRNCNLRSEVPEFHNFQTGIASWLNRSHYRCWCL